MPESTDFSAWTLGPIRARRCHCASPDGDPSVNLDFLTDPERNLRLIMKDGKVYKNTLAA